MPNGPDNYFRQKAMQQKSSTLRDNYNAKADQMDELQFNGAQGDRVPPAPKAPGLEHADSTMESLRSGQMPSSSQTSIDTIRDARGDFDGDIGPDAGIYRPQHLRADKHKSNIR